LPVTAARIISPSTSTATDNCPRRNTASFAASIWPRWSRSSLTSACVPAHPPSVGCAFRGRQQLRHRANRLRLQRLPPDRKKNTDGARSAVLTVGKDTVIAPGTRCVVNGLSGAEQQRSKAPSTCPLIKPAGWQ
jgi:hypothetical protein